MYAIVDNLVLLALMVVVATGTVSGHQQIIYVDTQNGTLDSSCWDSGTVMPCANLKLALEGAQKRHNAAVALLLKNNSYESRNSTGLIGIDTEHVVVATPSSNTCVNTTCPPWFVHSDDTNSGTCMCGNELGGIVKCSSSLQELSILTVYCMTHDKYLGTVAGLCIYNHQYIIGTINSSMHYRLPYNISELNKAVCGYLNRTGRLCGQCKEGFSPPVYSYDLWCVECFLG